MVFFYVLCGHEIEKKCHYNYHYLGGGNDECTSQKYTKKVEAPLYEPKGNPLIGELMDTRKVESLIREIEKSNVSEREKRFLVEAAHRHAEFNYAKIADYYANASREMQTLMEMSALVIIDLDKAIEYGYARLSEKVGEMYLEELGNDEK